ncbi:MAG: hypothetical protein ACRCVY_07905 [Commensalibacter sp.]
MIEFFDKKFSMYRSDGTCIVEGLQLKSNGQIEGNIHPNESFWRYEDNQLLFLNLQQQITTHFHTKISHKGCLIFFGSFSQDTDKKNDHILIEVIKSKPVLSSITEVAPENRDEALTCEIKQLSFILNELKENIHFTNFNIDHIKNRMDVFDNNIHYISRKLPVSHQQIKVVFLVHHITSFDSIRGIYQKMVNDPIFEPILASIPKRFKGEYGFSDGDDVHNFFEEENLPHIRFQLSNISYASYLLKMITPDIVFRQSPWDHDVPDPFSSRNLSFTRVCYVPYYGFNLVEMCADHNEDGHADQEFHRICWRIYCENEETFLNMKKASIRGGDNMRLSGHPKLDMIKNYVNQPEWPIKSEKRKFRLIWAAHHSIGVLGGINFGTFNYVYNDMLAWAKEDQDIEIIFRPHPVLFSVLGIQGVMTPDQIKGFFDAWNALPNTYISTEGKYGPSFAASDALLTDGISFLIEYQLFEKKPLLFLERKNHAPFNATGKLVESGTYKVNTIAEARKFIDEYRQNKADPKASQRQAIVRELMPFAGQAADIIVNDIKNSLRVHE